MLTQRDLSKMQGIPSDVCPIPMSGNEIQALIEEFPGIKLYMRESITKIYDSKVESDLLDYSLATGKLAGYYGSESIQEAIYFLDKKGEEVIYEIKVQRRKFFFFGPIVWKTKKVFGRVFVFGRIFKFKDSSVKTAVKRLGEKADFIRLLVSVYEYTNSLIIYRLAKGVSMRQIVRGIESEKASA